MEETAFLELVKDNERQILHVCRYYSAIDAALSVEGSHPKRNFPWKRKNKGAL